MRHYHGHLSAIYSLDLHPTIDVLFTCGRDATTRVNFLPLVVINITIRTSNHLASVSKYIKYTGAPFLKGLWSTIIKIWASLSLSCEGYDDYNDNDGNNDEYNKKHDVVFVELAAGKINKLLFWFVPATTTAFAQEKASHSVDFLCFLL